jgi:hypothetical protein
MIFLRSFITVSCCEFLVMRREILRTKTKTKTKIIIIIIIIIIIWKKISVVVRFEVLTAVTELHIFCNVTCFIVVEIYTLVERNYCLHFHGRRGMKEGVEGVLHSEAGRRRFFETLVLPGSTVLHLGRPYSFIYLSRPVYSPFQSDFSTNAIYFLLFQFPISSCFLKVIE